MATPPRGGYAKPRVSGERLPSCLKVSIEIEAELPEGAPEDVQRTVSENAGVLKFDSHGFERE
jgi:hypothetical protein